MSKKIYDKIYKELKPDFLEVIDESHLHKGHGNFIGESGTHLRIIINSTELSKLSKIKAHQRIYKILDDELKQNLHALAIKLINQN